MKRFLFFLAVFSIGVSVAAAQTGVTRETVPGITNFAHLETTVACAGAITPESVAGIKEMGFESIINLRLPDEPGANVEAEAAAAHAAGIKYLHLPFNGGAPDPAVIDRFLDVMREPGTEPAFIHCAGGNRAAAMWFAKRALVDQWDTERAMAEATDLGFRSDSLKRFMLEYVDMQQRDSSIENR